MMGCIKWYLWLTNTTLTLSSLVFLAWLLALELASSSLGNNSFFLLDLSVGRLETRREVLLMGASGWVGVLDNGNCVCRYVNKIGEILSLLGERKCCGIWAFCRRGSGDGLVEDNITYKAGYTGSWLMLQSFKRQACRWLDWQLKEGNSGFHRC